MANDEKGWFQKIWGFVLFILIAYSMVTISIGLVGSFGLCIPKVSAYAIDRLNGLIEMINEIILRVFGGIGFPYLDNPCM